MKYIFFMLLMGVLSFTATAQFYIAPGATVTVKGTGDITLENISLINDGTLDAAGSTVNFLFVERAGSTDQLLGGIGASMLPDITLQMNNYNLLLNGNIDINGNITFVSGHFDLAGYNVLLDPNGQLVGETESSSFIGSLGGEIILTTDLNSPNAANPGNLGAEITSASNLGSTTIKRGHQITTTDNGMSIARYYNLSSTETADPNAVFRFYYLNSELNGILANELSLWRDPDGNSDWIYQGFSQRDEARKFVEQQGLTALLGIWRLANEAFATAVEEISVDDQKIRIGDLYPNPVSRNAQIYLPVIAEQSLEISIRIFDSRGRLIRNIERRDLLSRHNLINLQVPTLSAGMYIVEIRAGEKSLLRKLIVQ
ncbi:MAG: T9SS type A sorting domain-containing protein [Saprospiraceae bacterium]|nr:T9SS type A sorting domain-containing protein [Saprospiraceae bacterium]